jgi:hypothetical protein
MGLVFFRDHARENVEYELPLGQDAGVPVNQCGVEAALALRRCALPVSSPPSCRFGFLRRAKPSSTAALIHSDARIESLIGHVVNPFATPAYVAFDDAIE